MSERFKPSLGGIWLLTSLSCLILPVFIPSFAGAATFLQDVIGTMTAVMFALSFPGSLLAIPLTFFGQRLLGIDPNTMAGMYLNLLLLFTLGYVQWFWLVPRIWGTTFAKLPSSLVHGADLQLSDAAHVHEVEFFEAASPSRVERMIQDEEQKL